MCAHTVSLCMYLYLLGCLRSLEQGIRGQEDGVPGRYEPPNKVLCKQSS